jgi:hypothetical protein
LAFTLKLEMMCINRSSAAEGAFLPYSEGGKLPGTVGIGVEAFALYDI